MIGTYKYVVAGLVALAVLVGAHELGFRRASAVGKATLVAYKATAEAEAERYKAQVSAVETKVVTKYVDRIRTIREIGPETIRELEVIRKSDCVLPPAWRWLHDYYTGEQAPEARDSTDPSAPVDCATATETITENYRRSRENAEQLKALQEWAASVSAP